jgi:hypothetical protein
MKSRSKKMWKDPVKGKAPRESTMQTEGNFGQFAELMKRVVKVRPPRAAETIPASPGPVASA